MRVTISHRPQVFERQADATVNMSGGTPPGSGTKYEWSSTGAVAGAIGTQKNVRIKSISVSCVWTVQPTPLEVHVTIDGNAIIHTFTNPVSALYYDAVRDSDQVETAQGLRSIADNVSQYVDILYEGRSVKLECEITGGTVSALYMIVKWEQVP